MTAVPGVAGSAGPDLFQLAASRQFAHLPGWMFDATWEPFQYPVNGGVCALPGAAAALAFPVQIESNAHFVMASGTMLVNDTSVPPVLQPAPEVLVNIGTQPRQFMPAGQFVPLVSMFGTGQLPRIYESVKVIPANQQITVTLTNLTATALNLYLVFHGWAVMVSG